MYSRQRLDKAGLLSFIVFLRVIWEHLTLPDPTPVQDDIADYLQNGPRRSVIEAFRGVGKSFITAAFVCWLLLIDPQLKIMVVSANKDRANDFSIFVKRLIEEVPILQHLRPTAEQRYSNVAFDVGPATADQSPSVKSVGITGQLTGSRADVIIADDVEVVKNSLTHTQRQKLLELIKEFDAVLKPGGRVIYLGTPQSEQSIYNELPKRGYEIRVWPAEVPENTDVYHGRLAPYIMELIYRGLKPGSPVDPRRFDEKDLEERRASYGLSGYALQFMLNTNPADTERHPLKVSDLMVNDLHTERTNVKYMWGREVHGVSTVINDLESIGFDGDAFRKPTWTSDEVSDYTGSVMFVDPSGKGKDETAYAIVKHLYGQLFLMEIGGFKDGFSPETMQALALAAFRNKVNQVIVEKNYGGGMFMELLKPVLFKIHRCAVEEVWHTGQKELRMIDVLRPVLQQHRLVVHRSVVESDLRLAADDPQFSLFYQLTHLTKDKGSLAHDDRLDALAGAVQFWVESMARDVDKAHLDHKQELLMKELKRFQENIFNTGRPPAKTNDDRWAQPHNKL
jgi:hypothetical protein